MQSRHLNHCILFGSKQTEIAEVRELGSKINKSKCMDLISDFVLFFIPHLNIFN